MASTLGGLVGAGPGTDMGLLLALNGLPVTLAGLSGYVIPAVRGVEDLLPDHDLIFTER